MPSNCGRQFLCAGMIFLALAPIGCTKPLQPTDKAEKKVELFLDAWSRGESPEKFADPGSAIQGTDPDWKAGFRLLSFLSAESKQSPEAPDRVRCRVTLSLQDKTGKTWDKQVLYDVQMGEKAIINRVSP